MPFYAGLLWALFLDLPQAHNSGVRILNGFGAHPGQGERIREPLREIFSAAKNLATADAESEIQALQETKRLHPSLIIMNLLISFDELGRLVQQLREIIPGLPVLTGLIVWSYSRVLRFR